MKKPTEDQLIQLAYGELSASQAESIRSRIAGDAESMAKLKRYQDLAVGLDLLKDIPEEQLSTERLRDAILGSGLKPAKASPFGWAWMPATALALAFGFMMLRGGNQGMNVPGSSVAMTSHTSEAGKSVTSQAAITSPILEDSTNQQVADNSGVDADREFIDLVTQPSPGPQKNAVRAHKRHRAVKSEDALPVAKGRDEVAHTLAHLQNERGGVNPNLITSMPTGSNLVLIGSEPDMELGATKAREVDTASNVVIGG